MTINGNPIETDPSDFSDDVLDTIIGSEGYVEQTYLDSIHSIPSIGFGFAFVFYTKNPALGEPHYTLRSDLDWKLWSKRAGNYD